MAKIKLIVFLLMCVSLQVVAQEKSNLEVLRNFARQHKLKEDADYAKAVQMANQKGWPIYRTEKNGTVFALQRLDNFGNPVYYNTFNNTIAAATTKANQLWPGGNSGLNLSGSSDAVTGKLGIWDGGLILKNHQELIGRIFQKDSSGLSLSDHATHTTGTMIASGVNPIAKGMAFGLKQLIAYTFVSNEMSNMANEAPNLVLSNHSYGITGGWVYGGSNWIWNGDTTVSYESYYSGYYDQNAQMYDSIAYHAPNYLMVFAAGNANGNDGNGQGPSVGTSYLYNGGSTRTRTASMQSNLTFGSVAAGQCAKDILVVGAVKGIPNGYSTPSDVQIASFSSWGPTDDGRIKPDIVADGVNVTSSSSASATSYETQSGTSMSSPNATGSLLLLQEYYNQKHTGTFMRSTTLKALAIQTADEAGANPGPDFVYGYGLLNVLKASSVITSSYNNKTDTIIEKTLSNATPYTINVIASGNGPLKATIVWNDAPSSVITDKAQILNNTTPKLINDLDLRISSGSSTYYPWILDPTNPTAAATKGDDKINNVEQVQVDSVVPGKSYTITVSNKGTLVRNGTQAFSLIISGIGGTAYCASASGSSTAGAAIDSVVFSGIATKNISNAVYVDSTKLSANIEPSKSIPFTVSVRTRDASSNARVVRAYIDYNGNGIFESTEQVAQSAVISSATGKTNLTITTPGTLTIGNYLLMRVIVMETSNPSDINPCGTYAVGQTVDFRVKVISPANDVSLGGIISPVAGSCANPSQFITVAIKNVGSVGQTGIPVTAVIKNGTTTIATLTGNYPGTIAEGGTVNYTFQKPFAGVAGTTYTLTAYTNFIFDQNHSNDTLTQNITITAKPSTPTGIVENCNGGLYANVTNPNASANYLWYSSATGPVVSSGTSITFPSATSDNKYYLSSGYKGSVGLLNKTIYSGGGYNNFSGNYVYISASVPVTIDYAKLYIGNPGQITFAVADLSNVSSGGYNYVTLSSTTIDAYATTPTATPPTGSGANPDVVADSGAYYYLNLTVPAGNHAIIINPNISVNTTIFRNLNTSASIYPVSVPNIFSITGNSVQDAGTANYQNYYYFFYDMKISTADCVSDVGTIIGTTAPTPTVTLSGSKLVCSVTNAATYQWYLGSSVISGAIASSYTPTKSGNYVVSVTDSIGCTKTSAAYPFVATAVQNVNAIDSGLVVSPNPNNGVFHVGFTVTAKANVSVELISSAGQICLSKSYSNFVGQFSEQFSTTNLASDTYTLKVQQNGKVIQKQVLIIK